MDGARTRGHVAALGAVAAMIRGRAPHAVLLVGPAGVGKTTLALDLAAGLLCTAEDRDRRPCGACRACRLVASGGHPDLHRLGPEGPGRQVVIGGPGARLRGVRDLVGDLALMPVEGGARIAIVESAQRMNDDAQAALLKTLEEPPAGVTIVLCADAEEPLLPTVRSRCARLRLGPVGTRDIETLLSDRGVADPPTAARLARVAAGRPGVALAWAADPDALRRRDELSRILLDLTSARPSHRLEAVRSAAVGAVALAALSRSGDGGTRTAVGSASPAVRGRRRRADDDAPGSASDQRQDPDVGDASEGDLEVGAPGKASAADRRRAAEVLVSVWTDVARDLLLGRHGLATSLRDPRLLEETMAVAEGADEAALREFLDRLGRAAVRLAGNAAPELILDDLALAWPHRRSAA